MARTGLGLRECEEELEAGGLLHKERFAEGGWNCGSRGGARRGRGSGGCKGVGCGEGCGVRRRGRTKIGKGKGEGQEVGVETWAWMWGWAGTCEQKFLKG